MDGWRWGIFPECSICVAAKQLLLREEMSHHSIILMAIVII